MHRKAKCVLGKCVRANAPRPPIQKCTLNFSETSFNLEQVKQSVLLLDFSVTSVFTTDV